jgi:hypothetical protein
MKYALNIRRKVRIKVLEKADFVVVEMTTSRLSVKAGISCKDGEMVSVA